MSDYYRGIYSTFVSLVIGEREIGTFMLPDNKRSPNCLKSISIERLINTDGMMGINSDMTMQNSAATATACINYTNEPDLLDYVVSQVRQDNLWPSVTLKYGYVDGPSSPVMHMTITEIVPDDLYSNFSMKLVLSDKENPYKYNSLMPEFISAYESSGDIYKLSDVVNLIAKYQGWSIGEIVETVPLSEPIKIASYNLAPEQIINDLLTRYPSQTVKGEGGFVSLFKHTPEGVKYYFTPSTYTKNRYDPTTLKTYDFFVNALPKSNVISFNPKFENNVYQAVLKEGQINSLGMISKDTNELISVVLDWQKSDSDQGLLTTDDSSFKLGQTKATVIPNSTLDSIPNYLASTIKKSVDDFTFPVEMRLSADFTVVGDPELNVLDYINIIPIYPTNSYSKPIKIHPSGGTYMITSITDEISEGTFTTKMSCINNGTSYDIGKITPQTNQQSEKRGETT